MPFDSGDYILLSGRSNPILASSIADILQKELCEPITIFSDGEIRVKGIPNLRRRHVFIIQPTSLPSVNEYIMELILMIDAAKRASAGEITAVMPYFGYCRQDRKEGPRVPISASVVASIIEHAGADRILTVDLHTEQLEGFIKKPWDNLYSSYTLLPAIKAKGLENLVVASPDKGGVVRATAYAKRLSATGIAIVYKERDVAVSNQSKIFDMIGDVKDKNVLMVDDIIDTAGTIANASDLLKSRGANKIIVAATHGLFSGKAIERIEQSSIDEVIVTNTVNIPEKIVNHPKVKVISVAPLLAEAIKRIRSGESISKDLII